ncbi:MAG: hypothetical protein QF898_17120 [SAR202 cluster bacterium]|nr:hypothetical protein [SAR202 cluster bacterium]
MKTVFILGAGASAESGAPMMADFLDRADDLYSLGVNDILDASDAFESVRRARASLQLIYAKSHLDLDNVESLFGAIEMGNLIGKFPDIEDKTEIRALRASMVTVIYKTLERSIPFPVRDRTIMPPEPFMRFATSIHDLTAPNRSPVTQDVSLLTFNYDVNLDYALHVNRIPFDYCLTGQLPSEHIPLLKLHGSINWGFCEECDRIVAWNMRELNQGLLFPETREIYFNLGSQLPSSTHGDGHKLSTPVLVPPTWNKTDYQPQLAPVWQMAARELAGAENIILIGYSLPETDSFFRYLFALGTQSDTMVRRLWVVNPDEDRTVEERVRTMIGRGIKNRLTFMRLPFGMAIREIFGELTR